MATIFQLVNLKTGLALNMINNSANQVAQLYTAQQSDAWEQWRFLMTNTETGDFQIVNVQTGMQLSIGPWTNNNYFPVIQVPQGSTQAEWTVRPPTGSHAGQGYFEIIIPAGEESQDLTYYVMKPPLALIGTMSGGTSLGVAIEAAAGNGGQENELWSLKNSQSPPPNISFNIENAHPPGEQLGQYGGMIIPIQVTNYSGPTVNLLTLPIPGTGALASSGVGFAGPTGPISASGGTFSTTLTITLLAGSAPSPAPEITIAALDNNSHAIAFAPISSQYWYQNSW